MLKACLALVFCLMTSSVILAQSAGQKEESPQQNEVAGAKANSQADSAEHIETLLAMSVKDRKAYIKKLAPSERRGLWLRLNKEKKARKGISRKAGAYQTPFPVDVEPKEEWASRGTTGTIAYDSGFPSIGFGGGALVGNRFNTHTAVPVLASGTVNTVHAVVVPGPANTTNSAGFVLLGPQTVGGGATALFSTMTGATGVIDTISFTGLGVNFTASSFFVLLFDNANTFIPVLGTETTLAQGHHGLVGYTGGMGITGTFNLGGNLNAFVRAGGNIVPVELMNFTVE